MKKLVVAVVTLILLLAVAPWGLGKMAEKRIDRGIDAMVGYAPYIRVVDRKWTHGWFHSEELATFEISMPGLDTLISAGALARAAAGAAEGPASAGAGPIRFQIRNEVLHGPVLGMSGFGVARVSTEIVISDKTRQKLVEIFGTDEPVRISTRVRIFGGATTTIAGDARSIPLDKIAKQDRGTLSWDAFSLSVGVSRNADSFHIKGKQPRIEVNDTKAGIQLLLTGMNVDAESERIAGDLYDTDMKSSIGKMRIASGKTPPVEIDALRYDLDTKKDGDFLDYEIDMGSGEVRSDALKSTAGLSVSKTHYDFTLRHLHMESMQNLTTAIKESYATAAGGNVETVLKPFKEHGIELLKHDPEFVIDQLGIETPDGDGLVKGVIRLVGATEQDLNAGMESVLQKLVADITVEVASDLINKLPNGDKMAAAALEQGYAKRDGKKLVSRIEFKGGQLTINGKAQNVPLPGAASAAP